MLRGNCSHGIKASRLKTLTVDLRRSPADVGATTAIATFIVMAVTCRGGNAGLIGSSTLAHRSKHRIRMNFAGATQRTSLQWRF